MSDLNRERQGVMRRDLIQFVGSGVILLATGEMFAGCGSGGNSPTTQTRITIDPGQQAIDTVNGQPITRLMLVQNLNINSSAVDANNALSPVVINAIYWGAKDQQGLPVNVVQTLAWTNDATHAVRSLYSPEGLPVQAQVIDNHYSLTLEWDVPGQVTLKFYDPDGLFFGGSIVKGNGSSYTVSSLPPTSKATNLLSTRSAVNTSRLAAQRGAYRDSGRLRTAGATTSLRPQ